MGQPQRVSSLAGATIDDDDEPLSSDDWFADDEETGPWCVDQGDAKPGDLRGGGSR
jgi:hypothetical protein